MEWLARPLASDGVTVAGPLDPARLTDADLRAICLRMHAILGSIEMPRCEGRLIPLGLFDDIDTLESMVLYGYPSPFGHHTPPRLAEWVGVVRAFGAYYSLAGGGPIAVDPAVFHEVASRYGGAAEAEPVTAPASRQEAAAGELGRSALQRARTAGASGAEVAGRAGVGRRLFAVTLGGIGAGFGGAAPWLVPDACRWAGWAALALFVPGGCGLAFLGARGRAADLRDVSPWEFTAELAGGLAAELGCAAVVVVVAAVVGLWAALW